MARVFSWLITLGLCNVIHATLVLHHLINATQRNAVCLDGSPAGYYLYRNPSSTRWVVHLQGGGFCASPQNCRMIANSPRGSSRKWSCAIPQPGEDDADATVSSDSRKNPKFVNWNRVYVPYCSGDLFLGQSGHDVNPFNVSMQGHQIVMAVFDDLLSTQGMKLATHVLFGGSSAGSVGVICHLDEVTTKLSQARPHTIKVAGYVDYWFMIYPPFSELQANQWTTIYNSSLWMRQSDILSTVAKAYVNPACKAAVTSSTPNLAGLECLDPSWAGRFFQFAPLLVLTPRWDTYGLRNFYFSEQVYKCMATNGSLSSEEQSYIAQFGKYSYQKAQELATLTPKQNGASVSVFLANCFTHTLIDSKRLCSGVGGTSAYNALSAFADRALLASLSRKYTLIQQPPSDKSELRCTSDCLAKECIWATNALRSGLCTPTGPSSQGQREQECNSTLTNSRSHSDTSSGVLVKYLVVDAGKRNALCMDGSPGAYYVHRNTSSNKWVIVMQGGGFCNGALNCQSRSQSRLGSSMNWTCTLPGRDKGSSGQFETEHTPVSADQSRNPEFYTWNRVYLRYCTGDLYLGRKGNNTFGVNTLGYFVTTAVIEDLLDYHELDKATKVLIGGSSAGAIGSLTLLDWMNEKINERSKNITAMFGFNDGGWFRGLVPFDEYIENTSAVTNIYDSPFIQNLGLLFRFVFHLYAHPGCFYPRKDKGIFGQECVLTELTAPYVKTPFFIISGRWDTFDLHLKLGPLYGCSASLGSLPPEVQQYVSFYGNYSHEKIDIFRKGQNGIFLANCYKHASFGFDLEKQRGPPCGAINGITPYQALAQWVKMLNSRNANAGPDSSIVDPTPPDPLQLSCNSQCGAHQCSWATNLTGNDGNASCAVFTSAQLNSYGNYQAGTLCSTLLPTLSPTTTPDQVSSHDHYRYGSVSSAFLPTHSPTTPPDSSSGRPNWEMSSIVLTTLISVFVLV